MIALVIALAVMSPTDRPGSEVLAENRLAIAIWSDERMRAIYKPYFDCYWDKLKTRPDSDLQDLGAAGSMFSKAYQSCTVLREVADREADTYLSNISDYKSPAVRADVLPRYRRQTGFLIMAQHYHDAGKTDLFNNYLAKVGQSLREK